MTSTDYQAGGLLQAEAATAGAEWILAFTRDFKATPDRVWRLITDPEELKQWAPFDADRDLAHPGEATLTMAGAGGEASQAMVREADPPRVLEYTWGEDLLRWELEPTTAPNRFGGTDVTGTRLTLRHTVSDRTWIPRCAAGWHICLDVADYHLAGRPIGRIVAEDARAHGWERLNDAYASQLGIEHKGWPRG